LKRSAATRTEAITTLGGLDVVGDHGDLLVALEYTHAALGDKHNLLRKGEYLAAATGQAVKATIDTKERQSSR